MWRIRSLTALALVAGVTAAFAPRASADIIDFESNPALATGPTLFDAAGPAQTIVVDGVTFNGGVILGNEANISSPYVTPPNVYGTADFGDPSLQTDIVIDLNPAIDATTVQGLLINGQTLPTNYDVEAFSGATLVQDESFTDIPSNGDAGVETFSVASTAGPITEIKFVPDTSTDGSWDYSIDTIAINESITDVVPEPSTTGEMVAGLAALAFWYARSRKSVSAK